mmetsp:Transcript_20650/g.57559  ORF Transcript_20650/g.57559 Transcript_20650/m.57559 type:complete len:803 (+) Transcript_20650:102-2510(+)
MLCGSHGVLGACAPWETHKGASGRKDQGVVDIEDIDVGLTGTNGMRQQVSPGSDDFSSGLRPRRNLSDHSVSTTSSVADSSRVGTYTRPMQRSAEHMENKMAEEGAMDPTSVIRMGPQNWVFASMFLFGSIAIVITLIVWSKKGLLPQEHIGHVHSTKTRVGHVHSPIYLTPALIDLHGVEKEVFDVRIIGMALADFGAEAHERRLSEFGRGKRRWQYRRLARELAAEATVPVHESTPGHGAKADLGAEVAGKTRKHGAAGHGGGHGHGHGHGMHGGNGTLTYRLLAMNVEFFKKTIELSADEEVEHFATVALSDYGVNLATQFHVEVTAETTNGNRVVFMCQVLRMGSGAKYRFIIGMTLFVITFGSIVAEIIHRSYSAAIGASLVLCVVAAIQETPELHEVTSMIEWGTLMLLFSMMILMQMLAMTGFFNWFALKVIVVSKQSPVRLFFLLTNCCGIMSMVLDNVTCVLLTGPLTYKIANKMRLNPRPYYLAMTICATIGGTATLIGDPPNIVIGMKLKLGFETFLFINFPVVATVLMPVSSGLLYLKFKSKLSRCSDGKPVVLNLQQLAEENKIINEPMFAELGFVLLAVLLALLLSPIHKIEPAWFTVMAMFACALRFDRHHMGKWLECVEWDTLFFFALLFVLVEGLSELGVIRTLGNAIVSLIEVFPEEIRMYAGITIILWVSGIGSAFLESLPYTATMVYIIKDLMVTDVPGVEVPKLIWPLSIGACAGGIGSIMGSSANLVCMAISGRNAENEEDKVQGSDFIKHGFPVLLVLMVLSNIWLFFVLVWLDFDPTA